MSGRPKASVLLEPVWPRPRRRLPARASGIVAVWIGRAVMPSRARRSTTRSGRPRAAKPLSSVTSTGPSETSLRVDLVQVSASRRSASASCPKSAKPEALRSRRWKPRSPVVSVERRPVSRRGHGPRGLRLNEGRSSRRWKPRRRGERRGRLDGRTNDGRRGRRGWMTGSRHHGRTNELAAVVAVERGAVGRATLATVVTVEGRSGRRDAGSHGPRGRRG